ncbi:MAG: exopolyphosphatase [Pirellulaceae bacterium]|nr:exopolyphosphatase [Pirellulaceae bacterium]
MNALNAEPAGGRPPTSIKTVAVIDIGATSIRMAIGEIDAVGRVRTLDTLAQAVSLGKDTFSDNIIRKSTMEECCRVLRSYRQIVQQYQIRIPEDVRVVATSAVREARNRLAFIDRVYIATGLEIDPMDEAEVNRVTFLGVEPYLRDEPSLAAAQTVVMEVGGGSTEMLLVHQGNVISAHTFRMGSLRLRKALEGYNAPAAKVQRLMASQIQRMVDEVRRLVSDEGRVELIALGGDVRFAAAQLLPDWQPEQLSRLPVAALADFTSHLITLSDDRIVHRHHLSFPEAETVGAALLSYVMLARAFQLEHILVTNTNLRDGLLHEIAVRQPWTHEFRHQIVRSATQLATRYHADLRHAGHVARLVSRLFDQLQAEHQLDPRHEVLLHVAALLHEIGGFVSNRSLHKHSMYLIRNSEIFGLGKRSLLLVALVARYHRRASPQPMHEGYATLNREDRVAVAKMAALLRVAVALDESRSQRIDDFTCRVEDSRLVISIPQADDLSLEQLAIQQNGSLFEEVFGLRVLLRIARAAG